MSRMEERIKEDKLKELQKLPKWRQNYMRYKNPINTTIFIIVVVIFFIVNNSKSNEMAGSYPPGHQVINNQAVDFKLLSTEGKNVNLADFKGKVVLVDFWATWCPPCRRSIPDLIELKKKYSNKDFEILGISLDKDTQKDVPGFIKTMGINYPVLFGDDNVIKTFGGVEAIPTVFIINKQGVVVNKFVGLTDKKELSVELDKLIK